jgi:hypothetical protein
MGNCAVIDTMVEWVATLLRLQENPGSIPGPKNEHHGFSKSLGPGLELAPSIGPNRIGIFT